MLSDGRRIIQCAASEITFSGLEWSAGQKQHYLQHRPGAFLGLRVGLHTGVPAHGSSKGWSPGPWTGSHALGPQVRLARPLRPQVSSGSQSSVNASQD